MTAPTRIVGVDAALCVFPLRHALIFGAAKYATRDYTLLRIRTDSGVDGFACGVARGTPLLAALESMATELLGKDALSRNALMSELRTANVPGRAALVRAHSLVDLALWDVSAKVAGLPLHLLLGGFRERVPAVAVAGYLLDVRGEDAIVEEVRGLREQGFDQIKLMIGARAPEWTRRFLVRCFEAVGSQGRLALDVHYSSPSVADALALARVLDDLGIAFLEDPFPPTHHRWYRALATATRLPLAAGEDVVDAQGYADLVEAVRILRIDPSSCGGIDPALSGLRLAEANGVRVFPHGFPWTNAQLAGAFDVIDRVEITAPLDNGDRFGELLAEPGFSVANGAVVLDREPGTGTRLDWAAVRALASHALTMKA